jgi:uncharacterized protein YdhG (YjbR/CyaY superfamily)
MTTKPKTIDEYLAGLSEDKRAALEKLRKTIRAAAPKAEECISYRGGWKSSSFLNPVRASRPLSNRNSA